MSILARNKELTTFKRSLIGYQLPKRNSRLTRRQSLWLFEVFFFFIRKQKFCKFFFELPIIIFFPVKIFKSDNSALINIPQEGWNYRSGQVPLLASLCLRNVTRWTVRYSPRGWRHYVTKSPYRGRANDERIITSAPPSSILGGTPLFSFSRKRRGAPHITRHPVHTHTRARVVILSTDPDRRLAVIRSS